MAYMKKSDGTEMSRSEAEAYIKGKAAITISIMAALIAIVALISNANSSKILNNTITANNLWAWYQAKNTRGTLYEIEAKKSSGELKKILEADVTRMETDKRDIMEKARTLEAERDHARKRSPWYTYASSLLQVGVVLTTASILAVTMSLFWAGLAAGVLGALSFANGYWLLLVL